jgi:uncharacterized membrane protein YiaA
MFSRSTIAGAVALLAAPIVVIVATLVQPTLSDDPAKQVSALTDQRGAMIAGLALRSIAVVLLIAGIVWFALALAPRAPRLAMAGGVLGVLGSLVVLFGNGVAAAAPAIVGGLGQVQATAVLDHLHSNAALSALEPLALLGDIGVALLGIAAVRAGGVPRWAAAAIVIGALGEGAGFATSSKPLVIISFALLFAGLLPAVYAQVTRTAHTLAPEAAQPAAVS